MDLDLVVFKLDIGLQIAINIPVIPFIGSFRIAFPPIPIISVSTNPIRANMFNYNDAEPDKTPPRIVDYASSVSKIPLFLENCIYTGTFLSILYESCNMMYLVLSHIVHIHVIT